MSDLKWEDTKPSQPEDEPVQSLARGGFAVSPINLLPPPPSIPVSGIPLPAAPGNDQLTWDSTKEVAPANTSSNGPDLTWDDTQDLQAKYGTPLEQGKAALEGLGKGLLGPLATGVEKGLGIKPEDIKGREEANPFTHYGTEIAGLVAPAIASGGAGALASAAKFTQHGALEAVGKILPIGGETLAARIGAPAAKLAIDNMLIQGGDEVSKMILQDPDQSAQTAISNIGLAGVLGGALGGSLGAGGALWKATVGDKASKLIEDFKGRINEHVSNPNPEATMSSELGDYYKKINAVRDDVRSPLNAKVEITEKTLPRVNEDLNASLSSVEDKALAKEVAKGKLKVDEAYEKFKPALKSFESKFTFENNGVREIDGSKIESHISQLDKPNSNSKKSLTNFLEAAEDYKKTVADVHHKLGIESPVLDAPMNTVIASLGKKTAGAKLADMLIEKGLTEAGSKAIGAGIGGGIGGLVGGHGGAAVGAIIGSHALGPFFNSVLPGIAKALTGTATSPLGLKAAIDYGMAVAKGESLLQKSVKNIFKATEEVIPQVVSEHKDTQKLDKQLKQVRNNPEALFNKASSTGHYLPDHGIAIDQTTANAVTYLNSLRPSEDKKAPLDSRPTSNTTQKAAFQNALVIAQDPTSVLKKIQGGTITAQDITTLGTLYPDLFNRMKEKITAQMIDAGSKDQVIPYKTRIGLSMFLAQPLDSTMLPASIQAAQVQQPAAQGQQQAPQQPRGSKSAPALQKLPGAYQTQDQARQQRQLKQ